MKKTFVLCILQEAVRKRGSENGIKVRQHGWADLRKRNDRKEAERKSKGSIPVEMMGSDTQGNKNEENI